MNFPSDKSSSGTQGQGRGGLEASTFEGDVIGARRTAVAGQIEVDSGQEVVEGEAGNGPTGQDLIFNHFEGLIRNVFR